MKLTSEKELAQTISDSVNSMSFSKDVFVHEMSVEHRTLQQNFTRLCIAWLLQLRELNEPDYDLRNEASVKLAKKLLKGLDQYDLSLPHI